MAVPHHPLACGRVRNSQPRRMQHRPLRAASIRKRGSIHRSIVNTLAAQRPAGFAKMNADLMRPPGFEAALDQCEAPQLLQQFHMGNRALPLTSGFAAAPAVAAIGYELRFDGTRLRYTPHEREIATFNRV